MKGMTTALCPILSPWAEASLSEPIAGLQVHAPGSCSERYAGIQSSLTLSIACLKLWGMWNYTLLEVLFHDFSFSFLSSSNHFSVLLVSALTLSLRMPTTPPYNYPWNLSLDFSVFLHSPVFWLVQILYLCTKGTNKAKNRWCIDTQPF